MHVTQGNRVESHAPLATAPKLKVLQQFRIRQEDRRAAGGGTNRRYEGCVCVCNTRRPGTQTGDVPGGGVKINCPGWGRGARIPKM